MTDGTDFNNPIQVLDNSSNSNKAVNQISTNSASLNDRLNTSYVDVSPDDTSWSATITRGIVEFVGHVVTPKQMLGVLRVLKAITLSFLVLTIAADLLYMFLLEIFASASLREQVGGARDTIIRIYGLFLTILAIGIEFDIPKMTKTFSGLKGFIPRGLLLFFIATLTRAHPIVDEYAGSSSSNSSNNGDGYAGDDAYADDGGNADDFAATDDYTYQMQQEAAEIPYSSIAFQQVASSILGLCALVYFTFGVLCFDRFTSKAFLSTKNPLITTAIPQPNGSHINVPLTAPMYRQPSPINHSSRQHTGDSNGEFT